MDMTIEKYLNKIRDDIIWDDDYFDKYCQNEFEGKKHFSDKFIVSYDYKPNREYKIKTFGGLWSHKIGVENKIEIYRISKASDLAILVMTLQETHSMWKKFALRINRFENARQNYKVKTSDRNLLKVLDAEHVATTNDSESEFGTVIDLFDPYGGHNYIILLNDEATVAHHLLATK